MMALPGDPKSGKSGIIGIVPLLLAAAILMAAPPGPTFGGPKPKINVLAFTLDPKDPRRSRFGDLEWRGGLVLSSADPEFGGFSGIVVGKDGQQLLGVSDAGRWLTSHLVYEDGRLAGIENVAMSDILGAPGERLRGKVQHDSEGIGIATNGNLLISFERYHRIGRYDFAKNGVRARASYIDLPDEISSFSANKGFESVGQFSDGMPLAGNILVIAERYLDDAGNHSGWLLSPTDARRIAIQRSAEFDITDLAILQGGCVIVLERRYSLFFGPAMRLRLITPDELIAGKPISGHVLLSARSDLEIDNMEGLSAHTSAAGETILTLISDDNFRSSQRTLIMQFAMLRNPAGDWRKCSKR